MLKLSTRRSRRKTAELNIAPLIDMVLYLLIFFLVTTSFVKETGIDVSRPTASTAVSNNQDDHSDRHRPGKPGVHRPERDRCARRAGQHRTGPGRNPEGAVVVVADKASSTGVAINRHGRLPLGRS
jgi:biopolymer transport protein ExbD